MQFFLGLSLALRSHDQFQASHWSNPPKKKLFGGGLDLDQRDKGTDHVISGPIRVLKKNASNGANRQTNTQTDGHRNSMSESTQWGRFSENSILELDVFPPDSVCCVFAADVFKD